MYKPLPKPPSLIKTIGPTFILLGLALGSGELILWPYIIANYGLGIIWGAFVGITFQYFLNTEVIRYALYKGESVFVGFSRISKLLPIWFVICTFIPWAIPAFAATASKILGYVLNIQQTFIIAVLFLLIIGFILSSGSYLYHTIEKMQKIMLLLAIPFILGLSFYVSNAVSFGELAKGLIGIGDGYLFLPSGISLASFMAAFAYSGGAGTLNLAQSYYIKEKGLGMGKYASKISSLFSKNKQAFALEGVNFEDNKENRKIWTQLWKTSALEHLIVFWGLGLVAIFLLAAMSYSLLYGQNVKEGLSFLFKEAEFIGIKTNNFIGTTFLIASFVMLSTTQIGVLESSSRIISENFILIFHKKGKKVNLSKAFYIALWGQILLGIIILSLGFSEPKELLTISAVLNAFGMLSSFPFIYFLNKKELKKFYQAGNYRNLMLLLATIFFIAFLSVIVFENFF